MIVSIIFCYYIVNFFSRFQIFCFNFCWFSFQKNCSFFAFSFFPDAFIIVNVLSSVSFVFTVNSHLRINSFCIASVFVFEISRNSMFGFIISFTSYSFFLVLLLKFHASIFILFCLIKLFSIILLQ